MSGAEVTVVGIGADGWDGLTDSARAALRAADEIVGSTRQLSSLPESLGSRSAWPSPMLSAVDRLAARPSGRVCVLASGDPMLHGVGATLAARIPAERLRVIPAVSAFALACARLGWAEADVSLVSVVGAPASTVARLLQPGRRIIVYLADAERGREVTAILAGAGFGASRCVVMRRLGAVDERCVETTADAWTHRASDPTTDDALGLLAVECHPALGTPLRATVPGLPDEAYESDGALTKSAVRAIVLASLAPTPGGVLWDVGAGSGSIGIEWMRAEPTARAVALERRGDRCRRIARNAAALGVPRLRIVAGEAPDDLDRLPAPTAIFIGGGLSAPHVLERCRAALDTGGRLVASGVTLEAESLLASARRRFGGDLQRIELSHAEPLGAFTGWKPQRPVVVWSLTA